MVKWQLTLLGVAGLIAGCDVAGDEAVRTARTDAPIDSALRAEPAVDVAPVCDAPDEATGMVMDVHKLINIARVNDGLVPLELSAELCKVADVHACAMIEEEFVAHEHPHTHVDNGDRLTAAGYLCTAWGENLAVGQETPLAVYVDWMASASHRANIVSQNWEEMGVAVRVGGEYGWYWVLVFAKPVQLAQH